MSFTIYWCFNSLCGFGHVRSQSHVTILQSVRKHGSVHTLYFGCGIQFQKSSLPSTKQKIKCQENYGSFASEGMALLLLSIVWQVSMKNVFIYDACTSVQILLNGDTDEDVLSTWRRKLSCSHSVVLSPAHSLQDALPFCRWDF